MSVPVSSTGGLDIGAGKDLDTGTYWSDLIVPFTELRTGLTLRREGWSKWALSLALVCLVWSTALTRVGLFFPA